MKTTALLPKLLPNLLLPNLLLPLTLLGGCTASSSSEAPQPAAKAFLEEAPEARAHDQHERLDHIFYIMMENHGTDQIIGNTADAPALNALANRYGLATNYFGVTHPSLPNYLAAISGDHQGIWDDCKAGADVTCAPEEFVPDSGDATATVLLTPAQVASGSTKPHLFDGANLVDQLEARRLTWKAYMQSIPGVGSTVEYAPVDVVAGADVPRKLYAQKHDPFMYFSDIRNNSQRMQRIVPFDDLAHDLMTGEVPNFVWISPDQCHDMHGISAANAAAIGIPDCASPDVGLDHKVIALGDAFLKTTVDAIMHSPAWREFRHRHRLGRERLLGQPGLLRDSPWARVETSLAVVMPLRWSSPRALHATRAWLFPITITPCWAPSSACGGSVAWVPPAASTIRR